MRSEKPSYPTELLKMDKNTSKKWTLESYKDCFTEDVNADPPSDREYEILNKTHNSIIFSVKKYALFYFKVLVVSNKHSTCDLNDNIAVWVCCLPSEIDPSVSRAGIGVICCIISTVMIYSYWNFRNLFRIGQTFPEWN